MKAFNEITAFDYTDQQLKKIKSEIEKKPKEYILGIDEEEYITYLKSEYSLEPLTILWHEETVNKPTSRKEWKEDRFYQERYDTEVYTIKITYPFTGSPSLFEVRPNSWVMATREIDVESYNSVVSFDVKLTNLTKEVFDSQKRGAISEAFANVANANSFATSWNNQLDSHIRSYFSKQKAKFQKENDFFAAINIPIDKGTESIFTPPTIKKKNIPQPTVSKSLEVKSEPSMALEMYRDIIKVMNDAGKGMERKPSLYVGKDEEGIRDQFLFILETRYDNTTATSETFNRSGKTDIILKYASDGSNIFVAECKFWTGYKGFLDTISQLFDRYLTWRDSKVAILMFVKNKDFTSVLNNLRTEIRNHPYYVKDNGHTNESSFSYTFHLAQDQSKAVLLEVMAFHFDKE